VTKKTKPGAAREPATNTTCPRCLAPVIASRGQYLVPIARGCAFDQWGNGLTFDYVPHEHQPGTAAPYVSPQFNKPPTESMPRRRP